MVILTRDELVAKRARILARFPYLQDELDNHDWCHRSCQRWDIAAGDGHEAGDAFAELHEIEWLLDG